MTGFNAPSDPAVRNLESESTGYFDVRRPQGARRVRLMALMHQYHGRLDIATAKKILADHYDVYLHRNAPSSRTIEKRYELDPEQYNPNLLPYEPVGALDGKVTDSHLVKKMALIGRWGSSSGIAFSAHEFLKQHPQWNALRGYLIDFPTQPWCLLEGKK